MVTEQTVGAKTSLTFVSCYCSWTQNFNALWKFLLEVYAAHFITRSGQCPGNAAGATVSKYKQFHFSLFFKNHNSDLVITLSTITYLDSSDRDSSRENIVAKSPIIIIDPCIL